MIVIGRVRAVARGSERVFYVLLNNESQRVACLSTAIPLGNVNVGCYVGAPILLTTIFLISSFYLLNPYKTNGGLD